MIPQSCVQNNEVVRGSSTQEKRRLSLFVPKNTELSQSSDSGSSESMSLSPKEWEVIFQYGKLQSFAEGTVVLAQGEIIRKVCQIASGMLRAEVWGDKNEKQIVGRMRAGEIFGEIT